MKQFAALSLVCTGVVLAQTSPLLVIPQIVNGGGWKTEIVLGNSSESVIRGEVQFFSSSGAPGRTVSYKVPAKGTTRLQAAALGKQSETGHVRIRPNSGNALPAASALMWHDEKGKPIQEATIQAEAGGARSFRFFGEVIGKESHVANSVRTGVAIANVSAAPAKIVVQFTPTLSMGTPRISDTLAAFSLK